MLREEFETRMGNTVTPEAFEDIHNLYICSGDMDKDAFCDDYKLHGASKILAEIWKSYKDVKRVVDIYRRENEEAATLLVRLATEYNDKRALDCATMIIGERGVIKYKVQQGMELTSEEREYIISKL